MAPLLRLYKSGGFYYSRNLKEWLFSLNVYLDI